MMWAQQFWSSAAQSVKGSLQRSVISTSRETYYKAYFFLWNLPLCRRDLLWLALAPGYMLLDTLRHELSHAILAWLAGVQVLVIHFLPGKQLGYFSFGYIILGDNASWLIYAAPYFCDLILFTAAYFLLRHVRFRRRWMAVNLVSIGLVSPLFNSFSGFINSFSITNDVTHLAILFSREVVTDLFFGVGVYYFILLRRLYRFSIFNRKAQPPFWLAWAEGKKASRRRLMW